MAQNNRSNIRKFNPAGRHRINLGLVIFAFILLYVVVCLFLSTKEKKIVGYQVKNGTLSENRIYTGIALRDEYPVYSEATGYVALFLREGERAAYNNLIYAIDETGKFSSLTQKDPNESTSLTELELDSLKQSLMLFSKEFDEKRYEDAIAFENRINDEMARYENRELMLGIDEINSSHINDLISFYRSSNTGIVTYFYDGYEMALPENLTEADFDRDAYEAKYIVNDDLVEKGSFVYKYTNNENWKLCLYVRSDELKRFTEDEYVKVKFLKNQTVSWGRIHIVSNFSDGALITLSFTNSMVSFASDRFVEVELLLEEDTGLKVPNSSIATNSFFLIDKAFVTKGGNSANYGVNRQVISDSGDVSTKFFEVTIYKETETEYYVSMSGLSIGDVLYYTPMEGVQTAPDQPLTFTVGKQGTLVGVYNINKGYADFKQIEVLYSNDEYSIVKSNSYTGLRAYDYIALDSSQVTDKDFVY